MTGQRLMLFAFGLVGSLLLLSASLVELTEPSVQNFFTLKHNDNDNPFPGLVTKDLRPISLTFESSRDSMDNSKKPPFRLIGTVRDNRSKLAVIAMADGSIIQLRPTEVLAAWRLEDVNRTTAEFSNSTIRVVLSLFP